MPDARPIKLHPDDSAADIGSLVALGEADPQPVPEPPPPATDPFQEPQYPDLPDDPAPDDAA